MKPGTECLLFRKSFGREVDHEVDQSDDDQRAVEEQLAADFHASPFHLLYDDTLLLHACIDIEQVRKNGQHRKKPHRLEYF